MRAENRSEWITKTIWVADDGTVFDNESACVLYEEDAYISKMEKYFLDHAKAWYAEDDRFGVSGFVGLDGYEGCIIEVDDTVLKWIGWLYDWMLKCADRYPYGAERRVCWVQSYFIKREDLEPFRGQLVLFSFPSFNGLEDWRFEGTVSRIIEDMECCIDELKDMQKGEK